MKKEENKRTEESVPTKKADEQKVSQRTEIDPLEKKEIKEEDKRQNWTDVAESHLGIDE
jgi:hypothetical protein